MRNRLFYMVCLLLSLLVWYSCGGEEEPVVEPVNPTPVNPVEKEKEDAVKLHAACIQQGIGQGFAAAQQLAHLHEERHGLLLHIAPDDRIAAAREQPVDSAAEQIHQKRDQTRGQGDPEIPRKTVLHIGKVPFGHLFVIAPVFQRIS